MENFDDRSDPLDLAFAHPKAGKKLKPGEVLPGLEATSSHAFELDDIPTAPDAALSQALDDAFSNPNFGTKSDVSAVRVPVISESTAAMEEKLARDLDDAFANPKAGNKIEDAAGLENLGLRTGHASSGLDTPRLDDLQIGNFPSKTGGFSGPKLLVIAMVLAVGVTAVFLGGSSSTASKPTLVQLD